MTFKQAVANTPDLENVYRPGLQALRSADRARVTCRSTRHLTGSVDLDSALRTARGNEPRWDYGVGFEIRAASEKVFWIEIHDANSYHVSTVLAKLGWLRNWLRSEALELEALPREFVWVASGKVALQRNSQQMRRLAKQGLRFAGRQLPIA